MNIEKSRVEVVEITFGTTSGREFSPFQEASLKPGQVIWVQTHDEANYQIRLEHLFPTNQLKFERQGDDVVVLFPNGGKVVLRDLATHSAGQSFAQIQDQLIGVEEGERDREADQQQARLREEREEQERQAKAREEEAKDERQLATDGEPMSASEVSIGQPDSNAVYGAYNEASEDSGLGAGLWAGLGLLGTAGVAYALDDDDDGLAAPTFAGGSEATASVVEGADASNVVYQAEANVAGDTNSPVKYSLAGPDASAFEIDTDTGEVRLREVSDFETKDSYDFTVVATNADGESSEQEVTVSVEDVATIVAGRVLAGPVVEGHGLTAEIFGADGEPLGTSEIDAQGNYRVVLPDDYTGVVLVRIVDSDTGEDYLHEGSGEEGDLTSDLRALGHVAAGENTALNVNPLSEILTRMMLDDDGGDAGTAPVDPTVDDEPITQAMVEEAKQNLSDAFGLDAEVDINAHATQAVNEEGFDDSASESQAIAIVLAALAGAEVAAGESMTDILNTIVDSMTIDDEGAEMDAHARQLLAEGAEVADE